MHRWIFKGDVSKCVKCDETCSGCTSQTDCSGQSATCTWNGNSCQLSSNKRDETCTGCDETRCGGQTKTCTWDSSGGFFTFEETTKTCNSKNVKRN